MFNVFKFLNTVLIRSQYEFMIVPFTNWMPCFLMSCIMRIVTLPVVINSISTAIRVAIDTQRYSQEKNKLIIYSDSIFNNSIKDLESNHISHIAK